MKTRKEAAIFYFQQKKYLAVDDFMPLHFCDQIVNEYLDKPGIKDDQCPVDSDSFYGELKCEWLLVKMMKQVECLTGLKLHPTYSYMRVYRPGEELDWHLDRGACEVSATINLGQSGDFDWPIWAAAADDYTNTRPVSLPPGAAMIYRGMDVPHWRDKFQPPSNDDWQVQLFLHYVDKFGPHAHLKFDGRTQLMTKAIE